MAQAAAAVAAMSVQDQAGSVVMASSADAVGTDAVSRLHLGGVILMGSQGSIDGTNAGTPDQVAAVTADLQSQVPASQAGAPLLIATDQEYGLVTRMVNGFTDFPGAAGAVADRPTPAPPRLPPKPSPPRPAARCWRSGSTSTSRRTPMCCRSPGRPAWTTVRSGLIRSGPAPWSPPPSAATKVPGWPPRSSIFPGIGRLATDTHVALPSLDDSCEEWNAVESVPMRAGVDAGVALVMTGHVELPAVGVTDQSSALAGAVVTDLLQGRGAGRLHRVELPWRDGVGLVPDGAGCQQLRSCRGRLARSCSRTRPGADAGRS